MPRLEDGSKGVTTRRPTEPATDRFAAVIEAELERRGTTCQEAARLAMLPADAFRTVLKGKRPNIDRADELCTALGISFTLGVPQKPESDGRAAGTVDR